MACGKVGKKAMARRIGAVDPMLGARVALLALCGLVAPSCSKRECKEPGTLLERYYGFEERYTGSDVYRCFGPEGDCAELCEYWAIELSINGRTPTIGSVEVCERVSPPDGWADAGYQGWGDAGYFEILSSDGGVDPNRILHVVVRVAPFCGT